MCRMCRYPDMTCKIIRSERIQLLDRIGQGGWGMVYRARDLSCQPPKLRAVKVVQKPPPGSSRSMYLAREVDNHYRVSGHNNVVTIHRTFEDDRFLYIVLDYCPRGDMWKVISRQAVFARNDGLVKLAFLQIIDAVQACHEKGVYHRDLKPGNILVSHDCTKFYLSDFGLSTQAECSMTYGVGTTQYKSPESLDYRGLHTAYSTERCDTWALGVILVNMLSGIMPWGEASGRDEQFAEFLRDPLYLRQTLPISEETDFILQRIFCLEPADAITLPRLRQLVKNVKTFWMNEEELASLRPTMRFIARQYLYGDSDFSEEGEMFSDASSTNSLEDDSDDSDEHSIGVHSCSLLALEEGVRGVQGDSANSVSEATTNNDDVQVMSRISTPQTPVVSGLTPPDGVTRPQQTPSLLAPPAPAPASPSSLSQGSGTSSSNTGSTSNSSNTLISDATQENQKGRMGETMSNALKSGLKLQNSMRRLFGILSK